MTTASWLEKDGPAAFARTSGRREFPLEAFLTPAQDATYLGDVGDYRILKRLGQGAMGSVYLAIDQRLGAPRALKVPRTNAVGDEFTRQTFLREARLAAQVRHPHVVSIVAVDQVAPCPLPILVMEYVDGQSLADWKAMQSSINLPAIVERMIDVTRGLRAIHDVGIVHRDLKPSNILIDAKSGAAKIADFGLARTFSPGQDLTQHVVGTPNYMSPEQIMTPQHVDFRSDIFSVGAILYELLTSERPFSGPHDLLTQHRIVHVEPTPPSHWNRSLPRDLETIVLKCLSKEAADRYADADSLLHDLQCFHQHRPIEARPIHRDSPLVALV